jgi:hypothetical protein
MKFSDLIREYVILSMEEMNPEFSRGMSFNMMEQRRARIQFIEEEMDKIVLDFGEKV